MRGFGWFRIRFIVGLYRSKLGLGIYFFILRRRGEEIRLVGGTCGVFSGSWRREVKSKNRSEFKHTVKS